MSLRALFALSMLTCVLLSARPAGAAEDGPDPTGSGFATIAAAICEAPSDDPAACAAETITGITLSGSQGGLFTEADAEPHGATYVWELPIDTYTLELAGYESPVDGYLFDHIVGAEPTGAAWMFGLSSDVDHHAIYAVFVPAAVEPVDSDGDGLSDDLEIDLGTDVLLVDSDGDGFDDGVEYEAGADPVDPQSFPAAANSSTLLVNAYVCPVGFSGGDYVANCGGEGAISVDLGAPIEFSAHGVTDQSGNVIFGGLSENDYTITLGVPGDFADFETVCGVPDGIEPRGLLNPNTNQIGVRVNADENVMCSFYVVSVDAKGDTAPPPASPGKVTALPNTGSGRAERGATELIMIMSVLGLAAAGIALTARRPIS